MGKGHAPLIVIPGLFGSMSDEIIPGTGGWSFGLAGMVYEPFVLILETMGYRRGKDLFICFYDWSQKIEHSASHYLAKTVAMAKRQTGAERVNLISHSMGGLVARAYVQGDKYQNDVDQLIQLCTPNAGSAPNYSYWAGGELPTGQKGKVNFVHFYMQWYLEYLSHHYKGNRMEVIHRHFPGLLDIVPGSDYQNYLIMKDGSNRALLPYTHMKTTNAFLDSLNAERAVVDQRNIDVTVIAGTGAESIKYLEVVPYKGTGAWVDGEVTAAAYTNEGDGDAIEESVFLLDGDHYTVEGTHIEVLYKSKDILRQKIGR
ncbi:acetyltransferase [Halobacillus sp. Nhm2S1]|uniref:lipase/acyltransferase domain-containing protein n=1 Tax=Halobacillus sp. Nhm2S1 TaxID=2866716 RepID=UPI0021081BFA|nr:acetyltransferase [Halobacillus sp. Nhm2S1]